jgi:hypothetical protein
MGWLGACQQSQLAVNPSRTRNRCSSLCWHPTRQSPFGQISRPRMRPRDHGHQGSIRHVAHLRAEKLDPTSHVSGSQGFSQDAPGDQLVAPQKGTMWGSSSQGSARAGQGLTDYRRRGAHQPAAGCADRGSLFIGGRHERIPNTDRRHRAHRPGSSTVGPLYGRRSPEQRLRRRPQPPPHSSLS